MHFIGFFHQSYFHLMKKILFGQKYFSSMELLFKKRTILIDPQRPASAYGNNYFYQSSF